MITLIAVNQQSLRKPSSANCQYRKYSHQRIKKELNNSKGRSVSNDCQLYNSTKNVIETVRNAQYLFGVRVDGHLVFSRSEKSAKYLWELIILAILAGLRPELTAISHQNKKIKSFMGIHGRPVTVMKYNT